MSIKKYEKRLNLTFVKPKERKLRTRTYRALLMSSSRKDVEYTPKVLFQDITYVDNNHETRLFREHCWVKESNRLTKFYPKQKQIAVRIEFTAIIEEYPSCYGGTKKTLKHIRNIKLQDT